MQLQNTVLILCKNANLSGVCQYGRMGEEKGWNAGISTQEGFYLGEGSRIMVIFIGLTWL